MYKNHEISKILNNHNLQIIFWVAKSVEYSYIDLEGSALAFRNLSKNAFSYILVLSYLEKFKCP